MGTVYIISHSSASPDYYISEDSNARNGLDSEDQQPPPSAAMLKGCDRDKECARRTKSIFIIGP